VVENLFFEKLLTLDTMSISFHKTFEMESLTGLPTGLPKGKRRYHKKPKCEPKIGETAKLDRRQAVHEAASYCRRKGKKPTLMGQPVDGHWVHTASGWKRSVPEVEKLPDQQITRYFKITKTIQEIEQSDIPPLSVPIEQKEHSEFFTVPTLERSETIRL